MSKRKRGSSSPICPYCQSGKTYRVYQRIFCESCKETWLITRSNYNPLKPGFDRIRRINRWH